MGEHHLTEEQSQEAPMESVSLGGGVDTGAVPVSIPNDIPIPQAGETTPSSTLPNLPKDDLVRKLMGVFAVASALSIFLWFMAGAGFPWFIYIVYSVALIDCIIYGSLTKNYIYATTNVMLFLTFLACGGGYPWFMIPLCSMAIAPVAQYIFKSFPSPVRWFYIHAAIYLLINSMLFFIWMVNSRHEAYPWFIYPWGGWGILLLIQYNVVVMHDKSRLFVLICADVGIMLMITFRFAIGPLFMVFVLVALVAAVCYYLFLKKGYIAHCWCVKRAQQPTQPPADGQVPAGQAQVPPQPQPFYQNLPQFHVQFQPPNYAQAPMPPQGQPVYFQGPPNAYYQPNAAPAGPAYYAYFPSNNGLYPTLQTVPPTVPASEPQPIPTAAAQSDAVLATEVTREDKGKGKGNQEDDDEGGHLLRNSPTRSYSAPNDK